MQEKQRKQLSTFTHPIRTGQHRLNKAPLLSYLLKPNLLRRNKPQPLSPLLKQKKNDLKSSTSPIQSPDLLTIPRPIVKEAQLTQNIIKHAQQIFTIQYLLRTPLILQAPGIKIYKSTHDRLNFTMVQ